LEDENYNLRKQKQEL